MHYEMEELLPVVGRLVQDYTSFESTSIPYEKAEQFMEAVLYCIHEIELEDPPSSVFAGRIPAQKAYEIGKHLAEKKTAMALDLYHEILPEFVSYGNHCLEDTFIKGLPRFFQWYDIKFEPQNTILTLDYPVLKDLSAYSGIDRIYEFITCIRLEQRFLRKFPENEVINILSQYDPSCKDMVDNLCEIVFAAVIAHILAGKPLSDNWKEDDILKIKKIYSEQNLQDIQKQLKHSLTIFFETYYGNDSELFAYLSSSISGIAAWLKIAVKNGTLFFTEK